MEEMMGMGSLEKRRRIEEEDEDVLGVGLGLPGFRFHPTDEELVGFYLSRKVLKKPPSKIDHLIHPIDIYKYDPWDLPRSRNTEKESYFFCKRGRKYRNSIRPNRVTGSGFWKATGIDKPVYSDTNSTAAPVIGLKKTLVYYVGCAGKGSKTDWMMHEFRLPTTNDNNFFIHHPHPHTTTTTTPASSSQDAEVWTLCRIFKRNVSNRKYSPEWRELATNKRIKPQQISSTTTAIGFYQEAYINFGDINETSSSSTTASATNINNVNVLDAKLNERSVLQPQQQQQLHPIDSNVYVPHLSQHKHTHHQTYDNWDELRSVVEFAFAPSSL